MPSAPSSSARRIRETAWERLAPEIRPWDLASRDMPSSKRWISSVSGYRAPIVSSTGARETRVAWMAAMVCFICILSFLEKISAYA